MPTSKPATPAQACAGYCMPADTYRDLQAMRDCFATLARLSTRELESQPLISVSRAALGFFFMRFYADMHEALGECIANASPAVTSETTRQP